MELAELMDIKMSAVKQIYGNQMKDVIKPRPIVRDDESSEDLSTRKLEKSLHQK